MRARIVVAWMLAAAIGLVLAARHHDGGEPALQPADRPVGRAAVEQATVLVPRVSGPSPESPQTTPRAPAGTSPTPLPQGDKRSRARTTDERATRAPKPDRDCPQQAAAIFFPVRGSA